MRITRVAVMLRLSAAMLSAFLALSVFAESIEEDDLAKVYGDKSIVLAVTGNAQSVARAPSVATVITAAEIEAMGARDLEEVLVLVPGLHVSRSTVFNNPIFSIRGIHTDYNPQVLVLINGLPMTSVLVGERGNVWAGMPVENIARIEVIRGPGSALYGADALTGIISIFTKGPNDTPGTQVSAGIGSFNTLDTSIRYAGASNGMGLSSYLSFSRTSGSDERIEADAINRSGQLSSSARNLDAAFDANYGSVTFRANYKGRRDVGTGTGLAQILDPSGRSSADRITADLTWNEQLADGLSATAQLYYFHLHEKSDLVLFPEGFGNFPEGVIGKPEKWERHWGMATAATYTGLPSHRLRIGLGYLSQQLYKIREPRNYTIAATGLPIRLTAEGELTEASPFIEPHDRAIRYVYVQDEWQFFRDWTLTAGVRHDSYSDFGSTTNPRLALVWDVAYDVTAKLLYGKAFRPPSFSELYNINNPVATGNRSAQPETIETFEAAIVWQPNDEFQAGANTYFFEMKDILRFVIADPPATGATAQNAGSLRGYGGELEWAWKATKTLKISGNLSLQKTYDPATGAQPGGSPQRRVYMRADWNFASGWSLSPQVNWVSGRSRAPGDDRVRLPDYTLLDMTIRFAPRDSFWSGTFSVRNLFDTEAREPSPSPGLIENDLPLPGRAFYVQAKLTF